MTRLAQLNAEAYQFQPNCANCSDSPPPTAPVYPTKLKASRATIENYSGSRPM